MKSLKDRIDDFSNRATYKLLPKLPVIITINGRAFNKLTALLDKPFSALLAKCFAFTLGELAKEIDGTVFGYHHNDEIVIITRNDQTLDTQPWYNNDIQKLASVVSSIATLHFNNFANANNIEIGNATFHSKIYTVPNITEAINVLICKQQQVFQSSIYYACFYGLLGKSLDKNDIQEMLANTSIDDKINLLKDECGIDYNTLPWAFRRGVACYRVPKVVVYGGEETLKNQWKLDAELPIFAKEQDFLRDIIGD